MSKVNLMLGDCLDRMKDLEDNSVDSIVTDPPYGLSFMGKAWDKSVPSVDVWEECLRVLKPGGYLLAFAGTRTQHRMAVNIEDAGFEIRDMIAWVYGSGFPKSHDISKAIDNMSGAERKVVGVKSYGDGHIQNSKKSMGYGGNEPDSDTRKITEPATYSAKQWEGWGTALKPALEPITVARKPISEKTVAANVLKHGTGGINIDGSRIATNPYVDDPRLGGNGSWKHGGKSVNAYGNFAGTVSTSSEQGRFPANFIHDGSEEVVELFPDTKSAGKARPASEGSHSGKDGDIFSPGLGGPAMRFGDDGSAARFFYCPKTSKKDRNEGVEKNNHPTVKPTELMKYLVRMVTPKGGVTLDPFMGSGSTGKAAKLEGFDFIGIELDPDYLEISKSRIDSAVRENTLGDFLE